MKTTFVRNLVTYAAILLAALLIVGIAFQFFARTYLEDRVIENLKDDCSTICQVAEAYAKSGDLRDKDFLINFSVAAQVSNADAVICDHTGTVLVCSDAPLGCEHQGLGITGKDYIQQVQQEDFVISSGMLEGLYEDPRFVVSSAVLGEMGQFLGLVMLSQPIAGTNAVLHSMSRIYLMISLLTVFAAMVLMTVYARKTANPLRSMAKTATAFGHGDLKARASVPEGSPEELQELALAFNNMAASLEKSEYQRKEFIANVSHELKTPMTTIGGYLDGMLDGTIPQEKHPYYMGIVSAETKRLSRLVRSMLEISRLQDRGVPEEQKAPFDLVECIGQTLITFEQPITQKNADVQVLLPDHPVFALANRDQIVQVLYNLLDNAVKFCPDGGQLGIRLGMDSAKAYVTVFNDGETIPPEELPLLFDRFHKLDKSRSENRDGWGLGLYIVKTIICGHGENISVSSQNGRTEFAFTLPLVN